MQSHLRATVAAGVYAVITGKKVAGIYDHAVGRHLRIAAECRDNWLQALDGERNAKFGGTLPELFDERDRVYVSMEIDGTTARGYDRGSASFYVAHVTGQVVQLFDHDSDTWFAFDVQLVPGEPPSADR
ncbi:hypothetical protein ACSBM8_13785 [Sphingomonas sp. ASY06-1R]|jgi:hypothetical protein|uniref:hypothetical protein n=1 Tax=Sphingomonas sp. ASY06-1R TaxID=3445771 RepID=UPI003FA318EC